VVEHTSRVVLVTGANGFIGRNLCVALERRTSVELVGYDLGDDPSVLEDGLCRADVIFHLAGVNRPEHERKFAEGNTGFTEQICDRLKLLRRAPRIVMSSSIQASLGNPYGRSKRAAEECLSDYCNETGGAAVVYRLSNVFGKWSRPDYNSVVATFCHRAARGIALDINDGSATIGFTHVSDVVAAFESEVESDMESGLSFAPELVTYSVSVGELADLVSRFAEAQRTNQTFDMSSRFERLLYSTYLSYLPAERCQYGLKKRSDDRGSLAEFLKAPTLGQIFVSRTHPGIIRGNHYHDYKVEKFLVLEGRGRIRLRKLGSEEVHEFVVEGDAYQVVEIPPGCTHSIEIVGEGEMVTLFWCSDVFDASVPDTHFEQV
jgi:UDP-2-acetamido-2,6-beta-L-arabino-hexul-4-ose reductase